MSNIRQNPFLNLPEDNCSDDDYNNYNYNSDDSLLENDMIIQSNKNNSNNIQLLKKSKTNNIHNNINRKNKFENMEINSNNITYNNSINNNDNSINIIPIDYYIICFTFIIVSILCYGLYNMLSSNDIIYNNFGKIILYNYYIINLLWFSIFIIINIFLKIGKYYNIINDINYISYVLFNYNHIKYNIIIKVLFIITLLTIIIMDISIQIQLSPNTILPIYYNIIIIEIILSNILILIILNIIHLYKKIETIEKV